MTYQSQNKPQLFLRVGHLQSLSSVNGPGRRFVIWVQGCTLGCPGCINQQFLPLKRGALIRVDNLFDLIAQTPDIEGVTFSGGEPFQQAEALCALSKLIQGIGLTIMSYSGFTLSEIMTSEDPFARELCSMLDILIDGRFVASEAAPLFWRGSQNQKVHFLTARYRAIASTVNTEQQQVEISLTDNDVSLTGNLSRTMVALIQQGLQEYGITLRND